MRASTWARLDDGFWMHPKVLMSGNAAAGVFARMLSYSGCYLTDGLIPEPIVHQIANGDKKALEALEREGLIQRIESGSVVIPAYLEHNPSKEKVEADRRQRQEAARASHRSGRRGKP